MAEEIERIYVIPLRKTGLKSSKAAPTAVKRVKNYLTRHMKVEDEKIWIDDSLNNALWSKGKYKIPSKIRVKAVKFDDGVVEAYLPELEFKKSRRELLREEREKKEPILRKEEIAPEGEREAGAEDYEIAPTADGDVKIMKKKAPKEKEEKDKKTTEKPKKITKKTEKSKEKKETKPNKTFEKKESKTKSKTIKKTPSKAKSTKKKTKIAKKK
ncbi:MAG: 50S ribosomal protein L31e [Thermoplasmatales archaeon]|nr:MAG: 50S ribosomal protein L31e [Thermoplasmatales archaeon]